MNKFFDLHVHTTLKPMNSYSEEKGYSPVRECPDHDIWRYRPMKKESWMLDKDKDSDSKSNLNKAKTGNVKCMVLSLYPFEQGFMKLAGKKADNNKLFDKAFANMLGFDEERVNNLQDRNCNYFADLQVEYNLLKDNKLNNSQSGKWQYVLVKTYAEIENAIQENKLPIVLSIEGAAAFGLATGKYYDMEKNNPAEFEKAKIEYLQNVDKVKSWEYAPLFISPAHHFYNQVCGMAKSISADSAIAELIRPLVINQDYKLPDGRMCYDVGFTDLGKKLLEKLLQEREETINGKKVKFKRIFIDIKHLSGNARKEYFKFVEKYKTSDGKPGIPIIASHTAVNGFPTIAQAIAQKDDIKKSKFKTQITSRYGTRIDWFNRWSINLTDEEVKKIYESRGLIGFLLDETRLSNKWHLKDIHKKSKSEQKEKYMEMFFNHLFHAVGVINNIKGWDILTIGSDLDGGIDVMDCYRYKISNGKHESKGLEALSELGNDLIEFWHKQLNSSRFNNPSAKPYRKYVYDRTPEYFIEKLMWQNGMDFLKRWM
ncbi:MAG: hypothetical protein JXR58_07235 [Bacteroidales bacterium]|nr:hypothetical protein [Bacteroidales bacterium]